MCPPTMTRQTTIASSPARGARLIHDGVTREQDPGEPDGDRGDRVEQPDDQEPAAGIHQSREPPAPAPTAPCAGQQEHPQARGPESSHGHPRQSPRHRSQVGDQVERIKDRTLSAGQVRRTTPRVRVPERQPSLTDHRAVELEPGLELEHRIHQQPVEWLVVSGRIGPKTRLHQQHVGRAENAAVQHRLVKEDGQAPCQH